VNTAQRERTRYATTMDEDLIWVAVSAAAPCRVCGATAGCGAAPRDGLACCRSTVSARPMTDGGWLHVLPPDRTALVRG
jgi:hypothetical protein